MARNRNRFSSAPALLCLGCFVLLQLPVLAKGQSHVGTVLLMDGLESVAKHSSLAPNRHVQTLSEELSRDLEGFRTELKSEVGLESGTKSAVGSESGLFEDAHPGFGRVAAASVLGFDRLKRPKGTSNTFKVDKVSEAPEDRSKPEEQVSAVPAHSISEDRGGEVSDKLQESGVNAPEAGAAVDKFAADERRAAELARYKMLIRAAVHVLEGLNARLWDWGALAEQVEENRRSKVAAILVNNNTAAGNATVAKETEQEVSPRLEVERVGSAKVRGGLGVTACLNDCSNQGRCISRRCVCTVGFEGEDCSQSGDRTTYRGFESPEGDLKAQAKLLVCFVTNEVAGPITNGGIGTAFTTLAHSLAERGHEVTILFTMGEISMRGTFQEWVEHYNRSGIVLLGLPRAPSGTHHIPKALLESYEVLRFLRQRAFNVVHFPDYQGAGYYSALAKKQGLALRGTALVVGVHGPSFWAKKSGNGEPITAVRSLEGNFMEQRTVALADYVVAPSQYILRWMEAEGWQLDRRKTFVQPNLLPTSDRSPETARGKARAPVPISELVFFGRLETRKGVVAFCDAVDAILGVSESVRNGSVAFTEGTQGKLPEDERSRDQVYQNSARSFSSEQRVERLELSATFDLLDVRGKLERVTFLGRSAIVEGEWGVEYVQRRASAWGSFPWKVVTRMDPLEAKDYLRGEGRLAVVPSKVENSPYTVYECAELGIPFIASDVGGIGDLIHPDDRPHALFQPRAESLLQRLSRALLDGVRPARPAIDAAVNEDAWMTWHEQIARETRDRDQRRWTELEATLAGEERPFVSVVMTHHNRPALCKQALESLEAQDYPAESLEVILVDDGSTQKEAIAFLDELEPEFKQRGWTVHRQANAYLGAARNAGARIARGKYILFMDDDNWAKPHEVSTYVRAMEWGGADVMTSFVDFFWSADERPPLEKERPSYIFLGGSSDVGAFKNCFGDANCFVRKASFLEMGGYTEDYGIGYEDWEMYADATLRGFQADVLSEPVYWYRFNPGSMQKTTNYFVNRRRALRPYLNLLPESKHEALLAAVLPRRDNQTSEAQKTVTGT